MKKKKSVKVLKTVAIAAVWLAIWEIIYLIVGRELIVPSPLHVFERIISLGGTGAFWMNIGSSILRIVIGYMCALLIGTAVGIVTALSKLLDSFLSPVARIIRATPVASFIILMFVFIPKNNIPAFTAFLIVLPIVWANVHQGIRECDKKLLEMAKVFRLKKTKILTRIYIPCVIPYFMAAAQTGMGMAWKAGIAAEILTSPVFGIGTALYNSKIYLETTDLFAWTAVIVIISVVLEKLFVKLVNKLYCSPSGKNS